MLFDNGDTLFALGLTSAFVDVSFRVSEVEVRDPGRLKPGYWNFGGWIAAGGELQSDDNARGLNDGDAIWFTVWEGGELWEGYVYEDGMADAYGDGGCGDSCCGDGCCGVIIGARDEGRAGGGDSGIRGGTVLSGCPCTSTVISSCSGAVELNVIVSAGIVVATVLFHTILGWEKFTTFSPFGGSRSASSLSTIFSR